MAQPHVRYEFWVYPEYPAVPIDDIGPEFRIQNWLRGRIRQSAFLIHVLRFAVKGPPWRRRVEASITSIRDKRDVRALTKIFHHSRIGFCLIDDGSLRTEILEPHFMLDHTGCFDLRTCAEVCHLNSQWSSEVYDQLLEQKPSAMIGHDGCCIISFDWSGGLNRPSK